MLNLHTKVDAIKKEGILHRRSETHVIRDVVDRGGRVGAAEGLGGEDLGTIE